MPRWTVRYKEGDWFAVPLPRGGFGVGRIARGRRKILFGYFFGPRRDQVPTAEELAEFRPSDAVLVAIFGDLGLVDGTWSLIGPGTSGWVRNEWPMPAFARPILFTDHWMRVEYPDDPREQPQEFVTTAEACTGLPRDALLGSDAVGIVLDQLLP